MKIKSKLYILVSITLLLILSIALSVGWAYNNIKGPLQQQQYAIELLKSFSSLAYQLRFLNQPGKKISDESLDQTHKQLSKLLEHPPRLDSKLSVLLTSIRKNHDGIQSLFQHIQEREASPNSAIRTHLIDKLFNDIEVIHDDAFQLSSQARNKITSTLVDQFTSVQAQA